MLSHQVQCRVLQGRMPGKQLGHQSDCRPLVPPSFDELICPPIVHMNHMKPIFQDIPRHSKCHKHCKKCSFTFLQFFGQCFRWWHLQINFKRKKRKKLSQLGETLIYFTNKWWQRGSRAVQFWKNLLDSCIYQWFHTFLLGKVF